MAVCPPGLFSFGRRGGAPGHGQVSRPPPCFAIYLIVRHRKLGWWILQNLTLVENKLCIVHSFLFLMSANFGFCKYINRLIYLHDIIIPIFKGMFLCFCKVLGKQRNNNIPALLSCGWSGSVRDGGVVLGTTCSHPLLSLTIAIVLQGSHGKGHDPLAIFFSGLLGRMERFPQILRDSQRFLEILKDS